MCLKDSAKCYIDTKLNDVRKPYWSAGLPNLKRLQIEAHATWVANSRPGDGLPNVF